MTSLRESFRIWWQRPRRTRDREAERQVTFLELFYDLVYVALIAEPAHALSGHTDLAGLAGYAFLGDVSPGRQGPPPVEPCRIAPGVHQLGHDPSASTADSTHARPGLLWSQDLGRGGGSQDKLTVPWFRV